MKIHSSCEIEDFVETHLCKLCVILRCCICSKGLVGGWVEGALRRPWWVGGPFRTLESFFVLWETNFFFKSNIGLPLVLLDSTTVPTAALPLCSLLPYVLLHCRTAALLLFCFLVLHTKDTAPICFFPQYRPATGILREYH